MVWLSLFYRKNSGYPWNGKNNKIFYLTTNLNFSFNLNKIERGKCIKVDYGLIKWNNLGKWCFPKLCKGIMVWKWNKLGKRGFPKLCKGIMVW